MKAPTEVVYSFNPTKLALLDDRISRILWACIKTGHITSQYFNDDVAATSKYIKLKDPQTYDQFKAIIGASNLSKFGTRCLQRYWQDCAQELDDEFWKGVWAYIQGNEVLKEKLPLNSQIQETT